MRSILTALQEGRLFELPDVGGKPRALGFLARILDANPDVLNPFELLQPGRVIQIPNSRIVT